MHDASNTSQCGFESVENVLSDMENSTKYAKAMILRMQESKNQWLRSFEETINSMQSKLRQANNMYGHLNNQFRHVVAANWFLHARIASQEETIQKDQGIYEKLLKEYANLKSKISEEHCRQSHIEPDRLSADQSNDEIDDRSRNVGGEMILRQQLDQMTREYNEHLQKLKTENELLEKNQLQVHECYTKEIKQTEVEIKKLLRELKASRTRELLAIAKSPEDMMKICVKNEQTLVKEMDLISQDVAQKENEIKELNLSLKSVEYQSNEDRIKLLRQLQRKKGTIVILKKQKHLLHTRLNTVQESVELLKQEVTTGVISEPSQKLKQLIEIDVQLEQDYKRTQQDLQNHERRCSEHGVATPIELFEENILHAEVAEVLRENTILQDISKIYDRLQPDETSSLQDVPGSHDALDPLKIPDLYKNLYDNHWRDAFKAENIIDYDMRREKTILEIFEEVCAFCTDIFDTQKMVKIERLKQESTDGCYPDESRVLELMRNETTECSLNVMYQIFNNQRGMMWFKPSIEDKSLFVKESIRICWLMNLSEPPVLVHTNIKSGDHFDPNFYQRYACKGKKVYFVVLPALVRRDGIVVAKGIVECEPSKGKQTRPRKIRVRSNIRDRLDIFIAPLYQEGK